MRTLFAAFLGIALLAWTPARGGVNDADLIEANLAWDRGDYVAALTAYLKLLSAGAADPLLESIALRTGELYVTTELAADGSAPRFSPDGRLIAYQTGVGLTRTIRLVETATPMAVKAELPGFDAGFSPDGSQIVYLKPTTTKELQQAHAAAQAAPPAQRAARLAALAAATLSASRIVVRDLTSGREREIDTGALTKSAPALARDGMVLFGGVAGSDPAQIYAAAPGQAPRPLTSDDTDKTLHEVNAPGTAALVIVRDPGLNRRGPAAQSFGLLTLPDGTWTPIDGTAPSFSGDGRSFVYVSRSANEWQVRVAGVDNPAAANVVRAGVERADAPALSRDGSVVAFQLMPRDDWELYVANRDGTAERRLTREIQHDLLPRFLTGDRVLGVMGEARHRRSHLYDVHTGERTRLFHNNTVRTIAPEYAWVPNSDGTRVLISAERDGDTVSPERGVYLLDLSRRVTIEELRARLTSNLAAEQSLASRGERLFRPIAGDVRRVLSQASPARVFGYEQALYQFDSKHITQPGNKRAAAYLFDTYASFGYEPQYQWFEARNALEGRTANVLATLKGTLHPQLVYVVSSHYDSVAVGPGADDDSSGTAALLETARILAKHPQPATILFASFTGEESGLLGSREFVRRAIADGVRVAGALNNDMVGWANDHRLDNTVRYSNAGIRDVQHAAAMQFTALITYDALYYKGTDAAAYYEAYGDIVGGIGSYPILGNPHYHQPHDILETINHQLVTEVAKTTAATLMLLASSPSRLTDLRVERYQDGAAAVSWKASPEADVTGYIVSVRRTGQPDAPPIPVRAPSAVVKAPRGADVMVKAVNAKGLEGWDWARVTIR